MRLFAQGVVECVLPRAGLGRPLPASSSFSEISNIGGLFSWAASAGPGSFIELGGCVSAVLDGMAGFSVPGLSQTDPDGGEDAMRNPDPADACSAYRDVMDGRSEGRVIVYRVFTGREVFSAAMSFQAAVDAEAKKFEIFTLLNILPGGYRFPVDALEVAADGMSADLAVIRKPSEEDLPDTGHDKGVVCCRVSVWTQFEKLSRTFTRTVLRSEEAWLAFVEWFWGVSMVFKVSSALQKVSTITGKITGAVIAFVTIYAFFAIKPLPHFAIQLKAQENVQGCEILYHEDAGLDRYHVDPYGLAGLVDHVGQVVFVDLDVDAMILEHEDDDFCGLDFRPEAASSGRWDQQNPHNLYPIAGPGLAEIADGSSVDVVVLHVPKHAEAFLTVSMDEGFSYHLRGAVRADEAAHSEGFLHINLVPVDVYANSYLTSRYECSLEAERMPFRFLAPLLCSL